MSNAHVPLAPDEAAKMRVSAWDDLAGERADVLDGDADISYWSTLVPGVLEVLRDGESVVDAGCGVGRLSRQIALAGHDVACVDPSVKSIELASVHLASIEGQQVTTHVGDLENFAAGREGTAGHVVANMVLQDVVGLAGFLGAAKRLLKPGGTLVATIPNPDIWPTYRGYARESWFDPEAEVFVKASWRTALTTSSVETVHAHRPHSMYDEALREAGFKRTYWSLLWLPEKYGHKGEGFYDRARFTRVVASA